MGHPGFPLVIEGRKGGCHERPCIDDCVELAMAPVPEDGDSRFLSREHMELVADNREVKTRMEAVERSMAEQRVRIENAVEKAAHADAFAQGTIPDLQKRLGDAFDALGEMEDTANVYFGQIREMAKDIEKLTARIDRKAESTAVDGKADKGKTEEGLKNCFLWIKAGFVGITVIVLLWVLTILAEKFGIPTP